MAVNVYPNEHGVNITWEPHKDMYKDSDLNKIADISWHSNANSNGKPLFSVKVDGCGQYVKTYNEDGSMNTEKVNEPKK